VIDYLRLAFGTTLVLLPGFAVARALGQRSVSAIFAWALAAVFVAWFVVFTVHSNIKLAVLVLAAITAGALALGRRTHEPGSKSEPGSVTMAAGALPTRIWFG
jgi:multisubunit Na+/H+ antiporter MnhE subunit